RRRKRNDISTALARFDMYFCPHIEGNRSKPRRNIMATTTRLRWDDDETTFEGKRYGWNSADAPSVWTESGWKPLVWKSYHGLSLRARRAILRDLILSQD